MDHTLEVSCQRQNESYPATIELVLHIFPTTDEHNCFCGVPSRCMEYGVYILSGVCLARRFVLIPLPGNLQSRHFEELLQFIIHPTSPISFSLHRTTVSHTQCWIYPPAHQLRACIHGTHSDRCRQNTCGLDLVEGHFRRYMSFENSC
jgi:hypothetical protein